MPLLKGHKVEMTRPLGAGLRLAGPLAQRTRWECCMTLSDPTVFLVDVDNTLVDNDGIQQDLKDHIEQTYGLAARERYWRILEGVFTEGGYFGFIGGLHRF